MKPHAFIAMPFGTKPGADGQPIDFNRVYAELLKPALEAAGCEVFRADDEQRAGDIRTDMFQELLVADLVLADLTLDNPNVWYELGVRHALRARGVVLVQGPRPTNPFDIYTDRKLRYHLKDGAPDAEFLSADREAVAAMARATLESSTRRRVSPIYALLPALPEPEWQSLLMGHDNEFGEAYERWRGRVEVARKKGRAGDILVLADETPTRALWFEAKRQAGNCLLELRQYGLALEQFEAALTIKPDDAGARAKRVVCLGRLGQHEEAHEAAHTLCEQCPQDPEALALAGRVAKDRWQARWRGADPAALLAAAADELPALDHAIAHYLSAFQSDARHYYSGINALVLQALRQHLGGSVDAAAHETLAGGVRWAAMAAAARDRGDYWAHVSLAEQSLLFDSPTAAMLAYRTAVDLADGDWFALDSSRQTLALLRELQFRPEVTTAALAVLEHELARAEPPFVPRQVVLGTGHMVDAPGRTPPRLPQALVPRAAAAIEQALEELDLGPADLAITSAASGADLLFAEGCARRGARLEILLPQNEPAFVEASILRSENGTEWRERFYKLRSQLAAAALRVMSADLGAPAHGSNMYERCNQWMLYSALAWGADRLRLVCLWDGGGSDGPGGTRHMVNEVKRRTERVAWIDTRRLADGG